jgi:hypothetical protein
MKWRFSHRLFLLAMLLSASGCAPPAARTEAEAFKNLDQQEARIAANVPANYKQIIADTLRRTLKDPYSVRSAEISQPSIRFAGILNGGEGVVVCVRYNAKNSFGAYTGLRTTGFVFNARVIQAELSDGSLACQGQAFFPFAELVAG